MKQIKNNTILFVAGIAITVAASFYYYLFDFHFWILAVWLLGLAVAGMGLWGKKISFKNHFNNKDLYAVYGLLMIFVPLYFLFLYEIPVQMNTDEPTIMLFQKMHQSDPDIFGHSDYFGFASFIFIATAWAQKLLGGIDVLHARIVHATMAMAIIIFTYFLFRQYWKSWPAFLGAIVLGANHSLLAISRMAMRDNSALLVEVMALPLLYLGLKQKNLFLSFLGGCVAAFSFYVYQPGRILIFIWFGFLFLVMLFMRKKYSFKLLAKLGAVTVVGFVLVILPLFVDAFKHPDPGAAKFSRERFLFYREGQELQKNWVVAKTIKEGIIINIKNGLGTFNNRVADLGYIYHNPGFGFVDPISGVLLWIGVAFAAFKLIRRKFTEDDLLNFSAFIGLWLLFAFVVNKTPNYTRLFVVLPFFSYFVVSGAAVIVRTIEWLFKKIKFSHPFFHKSLLAGTIGAILVANILIFGTFVDRGLASGDNVGGTARYIEARKSIKGYKFYLASDENYPYYSWGEDWQWQAWMNVVVGSGQTAQVVDTNAFVNFLPRQNNFTVFMNSKLLEKNRDRLLIRFPQMKVINITPKGELVAVEIFGSKAGTSP